MTVLVEPQLIHEGQGAKAYRLIPNGGKHLDPFVIFDEFFIDPSAGFPMHPHSGFEGFQFLMKGSTEYRDDRGNIGRISAGEVRRFVPGEGFNHSETPVSKEDVRGYLLWTKLPGGLKVERTIFEEFRDDKVLVQEDENIKTTLIFGEGAIAETITPSVFKHLIFKEELMIDIELASGWNGFVYVSKGRARICGELVEEKKGAIIDQGCNCTIDAVKGTEMVIVRGKVLGEEILQEGHFVR